MTFFFFVLLMNAHTAQSAVIRNQFDKVLKRIEDIYSPQFVSEGKTLKIEGKWSDQMVNARARSFNGIEEVTIFGGLARQSFMTEDGLALITCHELGHLIGGAPLKWRQAYSSEGQSDYFAAAKCMKEYLLDKNNVEFIKNKKVPKHISELCAQAYEASEERAKCARIVLAGADISRMFTSRNEEKPSLMLRDSYQMRRTLDDYGSAQCRLDTIVSGALCNRASDEKFSSTNTVDGACHESLGDTLGLRPACWFKE